MKDLDGKVAVIPRRERPEDRPCCGFGGVIHSRRRRRLAAELIGEVRCRARRAPKDLDRRGMGTALLPTLSCPCSLTIRPGR